MTALPTLPSSPVGTGLFDAVSGRLVRATREAIVLVDENQTVVGMNPAAEQLFGSTATQVLGTSIDRFVPPRWRTQHASMVRDFARSQAMQHMMGEGRRVELQRPDGTTVPVEIALSRINMMDQGRPRTLFAAMLRDTSDALAHEQQLAALERRMRAIFELSPTAIWLCEDDVLVYVNRAAVRLFDVATSDALVGQRLWSLLDKDSHAVLRQELERTLGGQTVGAIVGGRLTRVGGERRDIEIALAALPDHGHRSVQMVVNDITERQREAADVKRSRRDLRELSASIAQAREEERRRIARELHDELGQRLTALKIDLTVLAAHPTQADYDARVAEMQSMVDDTLASVRRIASDLRPLMLDDLGLNAAIEWLARDTSLRMGITVHTRLPLQEPALDQRVATALYRMVQEALTNVARHAQAKSVDVALQARDGQIVLTVADDGVGFPEHAPRRAGSFGLLGLRERAHMLGGRIEIRRGPQGGTTLTVRLPSDPPSAVESTW